MSADPADVSSSCDELLAELIVQRGLDESLETHEQLLKLETYLNNLNNREGLGFVAGGNVLDKRRLGRIIGGVFGLFATVVPFLLTLQSSGDADLITVFGQMHNETRIYAYSPVLRTYSQSKAYCESLWMEMATVHDDATQAALYSMVNPDGQSTYLGATYSTNNGDWSGEWEWNDGSAFDYAPGCEESLASKAAAEHCQYGIDMNHDPQPDARQLVMGDGDGDGHDWKGARPVYMGERAPRGQYSRTLAGRAGPRRDADGPSAKDAVRRCGSAPIALHVPEPLWSPGEGQAQSMLPPVKSAAQPAT
eukprot:SAG22_NODE_3420_length_1721_cov_1.151048_1_plen_306_part_10